MTANVRILRVDRAFVLEKCSSFVDFHLWPIRTSLNPDSWLGNFLSEEQEHALHLLNSFVYFSSDLTREIFLSAFHNISNLRRQPGRSFSIEQDSWRSFCNTAIITYVTGESPSPTDSGYIFARLARQFLGIDQNRILDPWEALYLVVNGANAP
jgi:hypothetical protein